MFCGNCGSNIQDGLDFCPNCGKTPNRAAVIKSTDSKIGDYPLINLSAKLYTVFFEIGLWLILIIGPIAGGIIGNSISYEEGIFPGIIIGFFIGFVLMIQIGGLTSVFLKIKNNTDKIKG